MLTQNISNALVAICAIFLVSGCGITNTLSPAPVQNAIATGQLVEQQCVQQVYAREAAIRSASSPAQFMALANQALRCVDGIRFYPAHPDNQVAMQLNALAVVNFVKSGDIAAAQTAFADFTQRFAQQDLVMADYTSFIDTATALLEPNLSQRQMAMLNINPTLRGELHRMRQWSLN